MRKILFRGHDGECWRRGVFDISAFRCNILQPPYLYPVNPNSVGQYIGLDDKNNKAIFEGDIIKYDDKFKDEPIIGFVYYNERYCRFEARDGEICIAFNDNPEQYEVIGNVYENKDLLKYEIR